MMYDPDGRDPGFEQLVLLVQSVGGLLSRTVSVSSGDQFWRLYSDRPFDDILGDREVLDELKRYFFFEPLPFIRKVVFLATPHRGSDMSRGVVGRVGTSLISDPDHIHKLLYQLEKQNPDAFQSRRFRRLPTSIETLETNSPILTALLNMQPPAPPHTIQFQSIIGSLKPTGVDRSTDGVVPWTSSHIEGIPETIVRSDHGVQKNPEAIREVHRILLEHVGITSILPAAVRETGASNDVAPAVRLEKPTP